MDLTEALKFISALANEARGLKPVPVDDPAVARFFDGKAVIDVPKRRAQRKHVVRTLADFVSYVEKGQGATSPVIWFDVDKAVGVLDDGDYGLDTVTLSLTTSTLFRRLLAMEKASTFYDQ